MGRRLLPLILPVFFSACAEKKAPERKAAPAPIAPIAPIATTAAIRPADAAPAESAPEPPLPPMEVLQGAAAEKAIAAEAAPPAASAEGLVIGPNGVGPYRLGLPRNALVALGRPRIVRVATDPTVERAELPGQGIRARVLAGRLVAITVTGPVPRTEAGIGIGSTLAEAVEAHGEARPSGAGVVLADLPGVVFVLEDGVVVRVVVVGPESD
ncbi:MAG TPA: hypothetical protein VKE22_06730 [Haliangiales bacterium]|nr:hypothetical protein [Haliangiales bacterium]